MTIILSEIWGTSPRAKMCREYVFEYIQMIEEIVEEGIKKKEIIDSDANVIASRNIWICMLKFNLQIKKRKKHRSNGTI